MRDDILEQQARYHKKRVWKQQTSNICPFDKLHPEKNNDQQFLKRKIYLSVLINLIIMRMAENWALKYHVKQYNKTHERVILLYC